MSDDIVTMFAQAYSKKKPTLLSQQGIKAKVKIKKNGKKAPTRYLSK